ncbi:MAG: SDR family oxidoreductase [Sphingomonas sp.]|nr:SDR family oxidoreductase [Sphingomonas sp.]
MNGQSLLEGKVALVTGGARGIGRAISEALMGAGATVAICGRSNPPTTTAPAGQTAEFHVCDVRKADAVASMISDIESRHGRLDIVVNNAGGSPKAEAAEASPRLSEAIIALNLTAPLHVATAAHRVMQKQANGGLIVNIASLSGTRPSPGTAAYGAAKAGLLNLTKSLAMEWGPSIRVNAIVVGLIDMEGGEDHYGDDEARARIYETGCDRDRGQPRGGAGNCRGIGPRGLCRVRHGTQREGRRGRSPGHDRCYCCAGD